jgi:ATP-dependent Clp protease protease subunit
LKLKTENTKNPPENSANGANFSEHTANNKENIMQNYWSDPRKQNNYRLDGQDNTQPEQPITPMNNQMTGPQQMLERVENNLYFYLDIDRPTILNLNKNIEALNNELIYQAIVQKREPANIFLHINSYGGSMFAGFSAMDSILMSKVPVVTIVDGAAASAATFLSIVGSQRLIKRNSYILMHQLSSGHWGTYENLKDDMENMDKFMATVKGIYKQFTKLPAKKINEILKHDIWFSATEAKEYGLVDEII